MPPRPPRDRDAERRSAVRLQGALAFVLVLLIVACYQLFEHRASKHISTAAPVVVTGVPLDRPLPDVVLTDENGRRTTLSALHGRVVVLAPFATLCSASCAATTSAFTQLGAELATAGESNQVALVELSVDPREDTPARLVSFAHVTGSNANLLTGSATQVAQLWRSLGQYYQVGPPTPALPRDWLTDDAAPSGLSYADAVYFIGPNGNLRIAEFSPADTALDSGTHQLLSLEGVAQPAVPSAGWTVTQAIGDIESVLNHRFSLNQ